MSDRLRGLDVARFLALIGMVLVNFDMVMVNLGDATVFPKMGMGLGLTDVLQGRAAATFVVLAGIGLGLSFARQGWDLTFVTTLKRAAFLFILGLLNTTIFDADILHYYALYFLFGVWFLRVLDQTLWIGMAALSFAFLGLLLVFDYDTGWNWTDYSYADFWTPFGFLRNLFFNGWHPIVPWLAFILFGIWISRLDLHQRAVQIRLFLIGVAVFVATTVVSALLIRVIGAGYGDLVVLFATAPIPPMPLFILAGGSAAATVTGFCLLIEPMLSRMSLLTPLAAPGQQTLSLYIAHIFLGMGTLEAFNMLGGQSHAQAAYASAIFCSVALVYAVIWHRFFKSGPLETLMRRLAG